MTPTKGDKNNYIGIEIECYAECSYEMLDDAFRKADLLSNVNVDDDGSIKLPKNYRERGDYFDYYQQRYIYGGGTWTTFEVQVFAKQTEKNDIIKRVCKVLSKFNAQVNRSCGLHVHLDMRNRPSDLCHRALVNSLDVLFKFNKGRKTNKFCVPNKSPNILESAESCYGDYCFEKYTAINAEPLQDINTLEVRIGKGSVNADDIIAWTDLLCRIVDKPTKLLETVKNLDELHRRIKLTKIIKEFAKRRKVS